MGIRPTSGTVVGTTTGIAVPREQSRGDRLPSKPSSLPSTLGRAIPTSAYGAPLERGSTRPYPQSGLGLGIKLIDLETEYSTGPDLSPGQEH